MYCGTDLPGGAPQIVRSCPRCAIAMQLQQVKAYVIDTCANCGGMFFDASEFERTALGYQANIERVLTRGRTDQHDGVAGQALACPGCQTPMDTFRVDGPQRFLVDRCGKCKGLWLDRGEVQPVRAFVLRVSGELAAADRKRLRAAGMVEPRARRRHRSDLELAADGIELAVGAVGVLFDLLD